MSTSGIGNGPLPVPAQPPALYEARPPVETIKRATPIAHPVREPSAPRRLGRIVDTYA